MASLNIFVRLGDWDNLKMSYNRKKSRKKQYIGALFTRSVSCSEVCLFVQQSLFGGHLGSSCCVAFYATRASSDLWPWVVTPPTKIKYMDMYGAIHSDIMGMTLQREPATKKQSFKEKLYADMK